MNVLVVNCGSSSLKFQLINSDTEAVAAKGLCERIGIDGRLVYQPAGGEKEITEAPMPTHTEAIQMVLDALVNPKTGVLKSLDEVEAIGHRVLHGGSKITQSVIINDEVISVIDECCDLGPLHNPANLMGIEACEEVMPHTPQVAVFDTAFHQTMPPKAFMYGVPYRYYKEMGVRRYGFHGTSHRYVSKRVCEFLGVSPIGKKIIICHLGNGSSMSAVVDGKCVDTSMGLTPLEGVVMGTRSGSCDPAVVQFIANNDHMTVNEVLTMMNKQSGLMGISGLSSDMRDIDKAADEGNDRAALARDMLHYGIKKYIGSYAAAMGGVDIIVFTAGIGENGPELRESVMKDMEWMGAKLDVEKNKVRGKEAVISTDDSKVTICVIPTNEEIMIARDTKELVEGANK